MLSMLNQTWRDHWERVLRRLDDVRAVYRGAPGGTIWATDSVQSFFEAVHHLKDWTGNDPAIPLTKADGDALINRDTNLQISADIANGSKHFNLTTTRTGDKGTDITRNDATVQLGAGTSAHRFYIQSDGVEYDAIDVAEGAVDAWRTFLSGHGLI